jgi:hypothetical protein
MSKNVFKKNMVTNILKTFIVMVLSVTKWFISDSLKDFWKMDIYKCPKMKKNFPNLSNFFILLSFCWVKNLNHIMIYNKTVRYYNYDNKNFGHFFGHF